MDREPRTSPGATTCIDYTVEDVARRATELAGGPVDPIADLVGGSMLATTLEALRGGGQIATIATIATPNLDLDTVLDVVGNTWLATRKADLKELQPTTTSR